MQRPFYGCSTDLFIKKLKEAGIEVIGPILENECKKLNEIFLKNQIHHKTFIALKTATTIDGKIATYNGDSKWITSPTSRDYGRKLRKYYDAILTSSSTVIADNPTMEHSKKIILDRNLKTDFNSEIYKNGEIFVFCDEYVCHVFCAGDCCCFLKECCDLLKIVQ